MSYTMPEFLAHAIAMEREAAERYLELADMMEAHNNLEVASLFRDMVRYSNMHGDSIVERAAYRDLLDFGGLLSNLDPKAVSNLDKAVQNAMEFTAEVVAKLKAVQAEQGRAA